MLTEQLTKQDLVDSLDAEAIFDYLIQHGVIDEVTRDVIREEGSKVRRNLALLQLLHDHGESAIQLFINALRQSGQLVLASSLDVNSRIKPTYGSGYLGKERYKGQVTIKIVVDSVKGFFPKFEEGDQLEEKHGDTPEKEVKGHTGFQTPRRMHKSYENMTMIEETGSGSQRSWKIQQYAYDRDHQNIPEEDEDDVKVKSRGFCWCLCIPRRKRNKKTKQLKNSSRSKLVKTSQPQSTCSTELNMDRLDTPSTYQPNVKGQSSNTYSPRKGDISMQRNPDLISDIVNSSGNVQSQSKSNNVCLKNVSLDNHLKSRNDNSVGSRKNGAKSRNVIQKNSGGKENAPPGIHSTPTKNKTVRRQIFRESICSDTPTKQVQGHRDSVSSDNQEPVEFCTMWKSRGPTFDKFASKFHDLLDKDTSVKLQIVKHFEQERGTLVLSIYPEDTMVICNICMTKDHVKALQTDERSNALTDLLETIVLKKSLYEQMNVDEVKLQVVIDEDEVELALDDLT